MFIVLCIIHVKFAIVFGKINHCTIIFLQSETDIVSRYLCDNNISSKVSAMTISCLLDTLFI